MRTARGGGRKGVVAAKLDPRKLALSVGAVVVPGLALLIAVGVKTGRLSFRGTHKAGAGVSAIADRNLTPTPSLSPAAGGTVVPAESGLRPGATLTDTSARSVVALRPRPKPITREDCLERVGDFVRAKISEEHKHGRHLAREVGDLVAELDRTGRIPPREAKDRAPTVKSAAPVAAAKNGRKPPPERPVEVPAAERTRRQNESLGTFAIEQVRAGRQGVALGDALTAEFAHIKKQEAAALAAFDKARAEWQAAEEKARLAAEERQRQIEERRLARRGGRAVRNREPAVAQVAVVRPAVRQPTRSAGID